MNRVGEVKKNAAPAIKKIKERLFGQLKKGLIKCRDNIFNFLENPAIPPGNNASERGIRKVKIKMKDSGTFRSDAGADAFLDLLSIVDTTKNTTILLMLLSALYSKHRQQLWGNQ
jgi:hypothetical protein